MPAQKWCSGFYQATGERSGSLLRIGRRGAQYRRCGFSLAVRSTASIRGGYRAAKDDISGVREITEKTGRIEDMALRRR